MINRILILFLLLCSNLLLAMESTRYVFDKDEYLSIHMVTEKLIEQYPNPEEVVFIGIGRSPLALILDLKFSGYKTLHIPLSWSNTKAKDNWSDSLAENEEARETLPPEACLTSTEWEKLRNHFNIFVDYTKLLKRKLIIIDYTLTGRGLKTSEIYLRNYFTELNVPSDDIKIIALYLNNNEVCNVVKRNGWQLVALVDWSGKTSTFGTKIHISAYKDYAKFGSFRVDDEKSVSQDIKKNSNYGVFKGCMRDERQRLLTSFESKVAKIITNIEELSCFDMADRNYYLSKLKCVTFSTGDYFNIHCLNKSIKNLKLSSNSGSKIELVEDDDNTEENSSQTTNSNTSSSHISIEEVD